MMPPPEPPAVPMWIQATLLSTVQAQPGCVSMLTKPPCDEPSSSIWTGVTWKSQVCAADPTATKVAASNSAAAVDSMIFMNVLQPGFRLSGADTLAHCHDVKSIPGNGPDRGPEPVQVQTTNRVRAGRQQR